MFEPSEAPQRLAAGASDVVGGNGDWRFSPATEQAWRAATRARMRASLRAAVAAALLLAACIVAPGMTLVLVPLLPVPFALVTMRYGRRPAVAVSTGLMVAAIAAGAAGGIALALGLALFMAGSCGLLALVIAACGMGQRFQRHPLVAVTVAYLALWGAIGGIVIAQVGVGEVRMAARSEVRSSYAPLLRECGKGRAFGDKTCQRLRSERQQAVALVDHHTLLLLVPSMAIAALLAAGISLWVARVIGSRRGLPMHRPMPLRNFEAHWSIAYLLAAGLGFTMVGLQLFDTGHWVVIAGVTAAVLGAVVLVIQGVAVTAFMLARWTVRTGMRVIIWSLLLLAAASGVGIGWFLGVGILEQVLHLRRRSAARPPTA